MGGKRGFVVVFSFAALLIAALASAPSALAGSTTTLSLTRYADMAVDDENGHVFMTGGSGNSSVVVLDFNGTPVTTIASQPGAAGMVLDAATSTLYVALRDSNAISKIDTQTLAETGRISIAPASAPYFLALAGGRLWFSHDCSGGSSGLASIALDGGDLRQYGGAGYPSHCPNLATSPTDSNLLVATDVGVSPPTVYVYDVSADPITTTTSRSMSDSGDFEDLAVTPDGLDLVGAAGAPYSVQVFDLSDLASVAAYPTGPYPNSVAITSDGAYFAGGRDAFYDPDIYVFPAGDSSPKRSWELGSGKTLYPGGLAFSSDATKLFAASTHDSSGGVDFRVYGNPTATLLPSSLMLAASASTVNYNGRVMLTATLSGATSGTVTIYATPYGGTKTRVASGPVNALRRFSTTYVMKRRTTFVAEFAESDTHAGSTSAGRLVRVRAIATVKLSRYYGTSGRYKLYRAGSNPNITGTVAPNHAGLNLKFIAQRYSVGAWRTIATAAFPIQYTGSAYAVLRNVSRANYRVKTVFAGDIEHLGDSSAWAYLRVT